MAGLGRMLQALRHRGPDGEGRYLSPDGRVALGHRRLAVQDLVTGAQPLRSEDGRVHLIVNGEFYGYQALRRELASRGHRLRTRSDSEVALHLYEEEGAACLRHLHGEFAFILWDERNQVLLAARDRFGAKPLRYAEHGGALYLASEAKGLFAAGVPARWDGASLHQALSLQYLLPERTLFRGVAQVPPGHYLLARDGQVQLLRYFDLDYPAEPLASVEGAAEQVRERLRAAVQERLRADVPVACLLSGGLDSSAVTALAAEAQRPLHGFTAAFEETEAPYHERAQAEETAAALGVELHAVEIPAGRRFQALEESLFQGEGLVINGHGAAKYLLLRAVRAAGFKVLLTGEGADELFAGYAHLRQDLLQLQAEQDPAALGRLQANPVTAGVHLPDGESLPLAALRQTLGFVPSFLQAKGTLGRRVRAIVAPGFLGGFAERDCAHALLLGLDVAGQLRGRHPVHQALYLWSKLALAGYILSTLGDAQEMAHGVEGRLPFLDTALFALARTLPMELKIHGEEEKFVLREAMAGIVPEPARRRPKHPFMAPPQLPPGELLQDWLRSGSFPSFLERGPLLRWLSGWPSLSARQRAAHEPVLMMALSATLLQRRFGLAAP